MKLLDLIKKAAPPKEAKHCTAIILAAGSGSRMGLENTTKQMLNLDGMPVACRSIAIFEKCDKIKDIIVVAREDEISRYSIFAKEYGFKKIKKVVAGGKTRQESAMCGFKVISDKSDFVAIHDAARCLITEQNIYDVIQAAEKYGAASAASPVKDTIKLTNSQGFVMSTPERSTVWAAQTPQIFKADIYRAAAFWALKNKYEGTDDNSLAEEIGVRVKLVDCGYENIKITTPEDLHFAKMLLKNRSER